MKVFFNALIVHLFFNVYVFARGWKILPENKAFKKSYIALFALELLVYLIGFIFNTSLPSAILKLILLIGTSWMILIGYIAGLLLLYDLLVLLGKKVAKIRSLNLGELKKRRISFVTFVSLVVLAMGYGSYRFWHPVASEYTISVNKEVPNLDTLRVVMVADIHTGYLINKKVLDMYVDRIMEQKPDIILFVGDIIDYNLAPLIDQCLHEPFRRLKAPYGVYASTGNHEYRLNAEEKIAWLSNKAGLTVLRDTAIKIDDRFYLVGREDDKYPIRKPLSTIMKDVDKTLPIIVMNHEPKNLQEESSQKVDVALYGHTHNGQLFPYNLFINLFYEVGHGYKKKEDTHVYVTSGLGLSGPQYRIGTISEVVVLNVVFAQ
ncbi:MAG: hypothetical protein RL662_1881 [Bacteroidota bacterium]|jgi:predicted MPP superfamily phosphohydrolase